MLDVTPTPKQRAYLDFIRKYVEVHRRAPAEHEMQAFFGTTPPSVHQMVVTLTMKGLHRARSRRREIHPARTGGTCRDTR